MDYVLAILVIFAMSITIGCLIQGDDNKEGQL